VLVSLVSDGFFDADVIALEMQLAVRMRPDGKPVFIVDNLANRFKFGELVIPGLGHGLAKRFHDLHILVVHPDFPLKIEPPSFCIFGRHGENITVELVNLFFSLVFEIVEGKLLGGQRKWIDL